MDVKIYKPSKTAMQSGEANTKHWVLEYETPTPRRPEPLMGWTASGDTYNQVRLKFNKREDAENYARERGWTTTILPAHARKIRPRNYADNFKYRPPEEGR